MNTEMYILNTGFGPRHGGLGLNDVRYSCLMPDQLLKILLSRGLTWDDITAQKVAKKGGSYIRLLGPDGHPL
jgi:hypothetical protein